VLHLLTPVPELWLSSPFMLLSASHAANAAATPCYYRPPLVSLAVLDLQHVPVDPAVLSLVSAVYSPVLVSPQAMPVGRSLLLLKLQSLPAELTM
ncbi:hypothetical protein Tco_1277068, partial [Tanacetum coccineum]